MKVCFNSGLAWCKCITLNGDEQDDILELLEDYIQDNPDELRVYYYDELESYGYTWNEIDEMFIAINGGEFYIDNIEYIEGEK